MLTTDGSCRINAVHVGEATFNMMGASPTLTAKYAMADSRTGSRFGAGNRNQWSEQTMAKLLELAQSMEQDIVGELFNEGATTTSGVTPAPNATDGVPGL